MRPCPFLFLVALAIPLAAVGPVTVVEDGRPKASVVVGPNASPQDREAAEELIHYVQEATGARLPFEGSAACGTSILVGLAASPADVAARVRQFPGDGYVIRVSPGGPVVLAGNGPYGTAYAVYDFLERYLGVRWLWPGELGEVVPALRTLRLQSTSVEMQPAFLMRRLGNFTSFGAPAESEGKKPDQWADYQRTLGIEYDPEALARTRQWATRSRFGGPSIKGGHAFGAMVPPKVFGPTHPEYYALVNGKRLWDNYDGKHGAQLCTSNPDVVRLVTEYCIRTFDEHPDWEMISISPNDGGGFCECDQCRSFDTGATAVQGRDPEAGGGRIRVITDRIMTFANQVTEGVVRKHPNKKLSILAYSAYREPPVRLRIHPSLNIQFHLRANTHWNPAAEKKEYAEMLGWSQAAENLGVTEFLIQGALADMPRLFPDPMARSLKRAHELGFRYYGTQAGEGFATNGINYYVLSKLLWDPGLDWKQLQREYVETGFGKAAGPITRYFEGFEDRWREMRSKGLMLDDSSQKTLEGLAAVYPREFRGERRKDIDEALSLASGKERRRVEFIERGLRYVDLTLDAVEKTIPLVRAGWRFFPKVTPPSRPDLEAFRAALAAWQDRERFITAQKGTLVISYRWVQYNDHLRTFNPLWKMQEWAGANEPKRRSQTSSSSGSRPEAGRKVTVRQEEEWRARMREVLLVPDPLPPLDPRTHSRFEPAPGVVAERVTYGTQFGMRIPAIVYFPKVRPGKAPALIVVNGHGGDKYTWYSFYSGILYARAGAVVLTFDPAGEGERNKDRQSGTRAHDRLEPVDAPYHTRLAQHQAGLLIGDVMQAVSYLRQWPEVDDRRIGAMGYSLGSFIVALTGAIETRLHACVVAAGGGLRIPAGEFKPGSKPSCIQGLPYRSLAFLGDPPAVIYSLHASRGPTLVVNGTLDWNGQPRAAQTPAWYEELRRRTIDFRGSAEGVFEIGEFQPGAIHRPYFVTRPVALWLEQQVDFPNWTAGEIRAMPETYIREWTKAEHVQIDPGYTAQGLESGTHALGTGVPGLSRSELSVFASEEWQRGKDRLILEAWVRRTRQKLGIAD